MISIVQNFICTKEERLQVLREYLPMIGDVFGECEFYVNYNSTINLDEIYYTPIKNKDITKLSCASGLCSVL